MPILSKIQTTIYNILEMGLTNFLSSTYHGGNLMLSPYVQPLTFLQNFRPFFWEAHNLLSLLNSFENLIFLILFMFVFMKLLNKNDLQISS